MVAAVFGVMKLDFSRVNIVEIDADNDQQRLDNFLLSTLKGAPKSLIYRIIRKGEVRINKKRARPDSRIVSGDLVRIPPVRLAEKTDIPDVSPALAGILKSAIVFEDDSLIVVNKPHGIAVHGGSGVSLGLIEALRKMRPEHSFLELVHRLDRDTSGLLLVAKKRRALTTLQRLLADKKGIDKQYLALVHGCWDPAIKQVDLPLLRTERQSGERIVVVSEQGKASCTRFKRLASGRGYSLVKAQPVTGRTHQIRVHSLSQGHVIAGDQKYSDRVCAQLDKTHSLRRLFLHAFQLKFRHPESGEAMAFMAPLDSEWQQALQTADIALSVVK